MRYLALLAFFVLSACGPVTAPREQNLEAVAAITYVQDSRTGLCFATLKSPSYSGYYSIAITNVPCSAEVQKLVVK